MRDSASDRVFAGSIPQIYESHLVPLIFNPYAVDLVRRVAARRSDRILEIAAGTGVVTRQLASQLSATTTITATDLNQPMLDHAAAIGTPRAVEWRQADAMQLPFADQTFDVVVCQFGVMFFPDKAKAFAEARRVLRPGGTFLFNVWDCIEQNEFADVVTQALAMCFPQDPPRFMARIPHGYHNLEAIAQDLKRGGFDQTPVLTTLAERSRAASADVVAVAFCQGTPLRNEIEARDAARMGEVTRFTAGVIGERYGSAAIEGKMQAHVVEIKQ